MGKNLDKIKRMIKAKDPAPMADLPVELPQEPDCGPSAVPATVEVSGKNHAVVDAGKPAKKKKPPVPNQAPDPNSNRQKKKWVKPVIGRLPDGANFNITYNAATQSWTGTPGLTIPGVPEVFQGCQGGAFPLLHRLDQLFRAWELRQESDKAPMDGNIAVDRGGTQG